MATLTLTPSTPVAPRAIIAVKGTSFGAKATATGKIGTTEMFRVRVNPHGKFDTSIAAPSSAGTYTLVVTDTAGRQASATLSVQSAQPPAPPPPPPPAPPQLFVESITVSGVTAGSFTVTASFNMPCQFWIQYGTTTAYGSETVHELSFDYQTHIQTLSGLTAATTYNFRVRAVSQAGYSLTGENQTQATAAAPAPPPPPSGDYPPITGPLAVVANPAVPALAAIRTPWIDPTWGTKQTRVGEANQHNIYSNQAAWNCDGSLLLFAHSPAANRRILDGNPPYTVLDATPLVGSQWSNVNPNWQWKCSPADPQAFFVVDWRDAGATVPRFVYPQFSSVSLGDGEGTLSNDDQYAVLMTSNPTGIILVDTTDNGRIIAQRTFSIRPNSARVSQLGQFVLCQFGVFGTGNEMGTQVYDMNLNRLRQISTWTGHCDVGVLNGRDVFVAVNKNSAGGIGYAYLDTGVWTEMIPHAGSPYAQGHVSCRNIRYPGWAVFSSWSYQPGKPGNDQIIAINLANPSQIRVYAWAWLRIMAGDEYAHLRPFACPSPDMTRITYGSVRNGVVYGHVAEAP